MLKDIIINKKISVYKLSRDSKVPYTTVNEIVLNKKNIMDCSIKTISKLAKALDVPIEALYSKPIKNISTNWQDNRNKKYIFPIIEQNDYFDMSNFHPLKQKDINDVYSIATNDNAILSITVFGSSTNIRCNKDSDLDIMIELKKEFLNKNAKDRIEDKIKEKLNYNVDIIWKDKVANNSKLESNIMKGVKIYEQVISQS